MSSFASLLVPDGQVVLFHSTPVTLLLTKLAPARFVLTRMAFVKFVLKKLPPERSQPLRLTPLKSCEPQFQTSGPDRNSHPDASRVVSQYAGARQMSSSQLASAPGVARHRAHPHWQAPDRVLDRLT